MVLILTLIIGEGAVFVVVVDQCNLLASREATVSPAYGPGATGATAMPSQGP